MAPQQLVLVVEGNLVMLPHWTAIRTEYVDPIIAGLAADSKGLPEPPEYAIVVYYTHSFQSNCLLRQTAWTNDLKEVKTWLDRIDFSGGGCEEAAVAEALSEALAMCKDLPLTSPHSRHCLLIGTTQPYKLHCPLRCPPPSLGAVQGPASTPCWLADAQAVAGAFPRCGVSLSVISLPWMSAEKVAQVSGPYAGLFQVAMEQPAVLKELKDALEGLYKKYPHHLVLVSDRFISARRALRPNDNIPLAPPPMPAAFSMPMATPSSSIPPTALPQASSWSSNRPNPKAPPFAPNSKVPPLASTNQVVMNQQGQLSAQALGPRGQATPFGGALQQAKGPPAKPIPSSGSAESLEILGSTSAPPPRGHQRQGSNSALPAVVRGPGPPPAVAPETVPQGGKEQQYVPIWSGALAVFMQGKDVDLCALEAFHRPDKLVPGLTVDWPEKLVASKAVKQSEARKQLPFPQAIEELIFRIGKPVNPILAKFSASQLALMVDLPRHCMALIYHEPKRRMVGLYCVKKLDQPP